MCFKLQNIMQLRDLHTGNLLKTYQTDLGTIREFSGKKESPEFFFQFCSFLTPGIVYRCDISQSAEADPIVYREITLDGFDASNFETKQIFYFSKDQTRVPMFIVKKKVP